MKTADCCFRCGLCCKKYQPLLSPEEAGFIAGKLGISRQYFNELYSDPRWPFDNSLLIRHNNGACPFLQENSAGNEYNCLIHDFKPSCCREWESRIDRNECKEGLKSVWGLEVDDCGRVTGRIERLKEFVEFLRSIDVPGSEISRIQV
ncbi:MAG: YkgJ family cysteine cluster protein [Dehalococcoidales bacterium]|nr:YkgJ family cysteine cluster protein [Dehalococcoidales bacterium]